MMVCTYCGNRAPEHGSCCGEIHFEDTEECPECGSENTFQAHHSATSAVPECDYCVCGECEHQWGHG